MRPSTRIAAFTFCALLSVQGMESPAGAAPAEPVPGRRPPRDAAVGAALEQLKLMPLMRAKAAEDLALIGVNVIPMTAEKALKDYTIVIQNGRITALGPRAETPVPKHVKRVPLQGKYVLPGLSDMHIHLDSVPQALVLLIASGVTNVRSMDGQAVYLDWADQIERGILLGPRLKTTGPILDGQPGPGRVVVTTAEDARAEVVRQYDQGYRAIKTYTWLTREAYVAAVEEARKRGMFVTGHVPDQVGVDAAVRFGQNEIAHIGELREAFYVNYDPAQVFAEYAIDATKIEAVSRSLKQGGVAVNTTLDMLEAMGRLSTEPVPYLGREAFRDAPPAYRLAAEGQSNMWAKLLKPEYLNEKVIPFFNRDLILALAEKGVPLVLGTDSSVMGTGVIWGHAVHEELDLLVKAGFSPFDALRMATVNPAVQSNALGEYGTIEEGVIADLVILQADPIANIGAVRQIHAVARKGQWYSRQDLDAMMEIVRRSYLSSVPQN